MLVKVNGKSVKMAQPQRILDIIDNKDKRYIAAKINNQIHDLSYIPDDKSEIELLDLNDVRGVKIYVATLRFIISMACKRL